MTYPPSGLVIHEHHPPVTVAERYARLVEVRNSHECFLRSKSGTLPVSEVNADTRPSELEPLGNKVLNAIDDDGHFERAQHVIETEKLHPLFRE